MHPCDVLIVGGGPAGSTCARRLVQAGLNVIVMDKKPFPRVKPCAGWITPRVLDELDFDADDYARNNVFQPITGFRTGMIGRDEIETNYDEPVSYGILRRQFDHYLLERSGARLRLGEAVSSLEHCETGWTVNGEIFALMLIGAGGHFCPVARKLGRDNARPASVVAAQEVEFEIPKAERDRVTVEGCRPELFFCEDLAGYGWCFRKGDFLNIGLGRVDTEKLSSHVAAFCDFLRDRGKVRCTIPAHFTGHAYRLYEGAAPKLFDDRVLLIGDAAGLAYPQSGEGILPAIVSARIAADLVCLTYDHATAFHLEPYADWLEAELGQPRTGSATGWLPAAWLRFFAARLLATRWFSKRVVLEKWFLHRDEQQAARPTALASASAP